MTLELADLLQKEEQALLIIMDSLYGKERQPYTVIRKQAEIILSNLIEGFAE